MAKNIKREELELDAKTFIRLIGEEKTVGKLYKIVDKKCDSVELKQHQQTIVVERHEDGKFFEFTYSESPNCDIDDDASGNDFPMTGTEVFAKVVTKITYQ